MKKGLFIWAAVSGFFAVALGAFGSHGLKNIAPPHLIDIFKLGVEYQFYHTFALMAVAFVAHWIHSRLLNWAAGLFFAGIFLFSGSLYLYAILGIKYLGFITPIGGVCFLLAWMLLATAVYRHRLDESGL